MAKFMKNYDSIIASLKGYLKMVFNKVEKFGIWLLLIFIVYIILIIKVINAPHILNSIFLGGYSFLITAYIFSRFIFCCADTGIIGEFSAIVPFTNSLIFL